VIDSHCHLASDDFAGDLSAVVDRARGAGLTSALCIVSAGDEAEAARAVEVRNAWPAVRFAVGIHPHQAGEFAGSVDRALETVRRGLTEGGACAIGEIGLDYHYDFSPRDVQQEVFRAQLRLARELRLPVVIHTREATDDTFRMLEEEGAGEVRGVFHCFTGDEAMARAALEIDFYLSFAGIVTFPRAESVRAAAKIVPADRVLAETDAPYLAPVPHRGRPNEPAYVMETLAFVAALRGAESAVLERQVEENAARAFRLP